MEKAFLLAESVPGRGQPKRFFIPLTMLSAGRLMERLHRTVSYPATGLHGKKLPSGGTVGGTGKPEIQALNTGRKEIENELQIF